MGSSRRWRNGVLGLGLAVLSLVTADAAQAEVFRGTFVLEKPRLASQLAVNREVDAAAQEQLAEAFVRVRLSPALMRLRGDAVRTALEPFSGLVQKFTVSSRTDLPGDRVRIVCQGDVDAGNVVLRLVQGDVLSFKGDSPRLALMPAEGTRADWLQALRARASEPVRSVGVTLLASEVLAPEAGRGGVRVAVNPVSTDNAAGTGGAHFIADTTVSAIRAPRVPGVVFDVTVRYTLRRPYDSAILAERTFPSVRASGISEDMAMQRALDEVAPVFANALAGDLSQGIFDYSRTIDPDVAGREVTIHVMERAAPADTTALTEMLKNKGFAVNFAAGRTAIGGRTPRESLAVQGRGASREEVFDLLATAKFGPGKDLQAGVFEHGADYLVVEIFNGTPTNAPVTTLPAATEPPPSAGPAPVPTGTNPNPAPTGTPQPIPVPVPRPEVIQVSNGGRAPKALELEFSGAFLGATQPRRRN